MISCSLKQQVWLRGGENIQSPTATRPEMQLIQLCWYSTKYWPLKDKTWDKNSGQSFPVLLWPNRVQDPALQTD